MLGGMPVLHASRDGHAHVVTQMAKLKAGTKPWRKTVATVKVERLWLRLVLMKPSCVIGSDVSTALATEKNLTSAACWVGILG